MLRPVSCAPQPQPHFIRGPGGCPRLTFGSSLGGPGGSGVLQSARILAHVLIPTPHKDAPVRLNDLNN